jgi:hypothetical protein
MWTLLPAQRHYKGRPATTRQNAEKFFDSLGVGLPGCLQVIKNQECGLLFQKSENRRFGIGARRQTCLTDYPCEKGLT